MSRRVLLLVADADLSLAHYVGQVGRILRASGNDVVVAGPHDDLAVLGAADPALFAPESGLIATAEVAIDDANPQARAVTQATIQATARTSDVVHACGLAAGAAAVHAVRRLPRRSRPRLVVTIPVSADARGLGAVRDSWREQVIVSGADVVLVADPSRLEALRRASRARSVADSLMRSHTSSVERAVQPVAVIHSSDGGARSHSPNSEAERSAQRFLVGLPGDGPVVMSVASAAGRSLQPVLDAAQKLGTPRAHWLIVVPPAQLCPAGALGGEQTAAVRASAGFGPSDPVVVSDRLAELPDILRLCDVFAAATPAQTRDLGLAEALAAGTAIVTVDTPAAREVTGASAGLRVAPDDAAALAAAVDRLLTDPLARAQQERAARSRARHLPGAHELAAQLARAYADPGVVYPTAPLD